MGQFEAEIKKAIKHRMSARLTRREAFRRVQNICFLKERDLRKAIDKLKAKAAGRELSAEEVTQIAAWEEKIPLQKAKGRGRKGGSP